MTELSTLPLLLEIGCEEIPARFLSQAQRDLGEKLRGALEDSRLVPGCSGGVPTAAGKESATEPPHQPDLAAMRTSPLQTYSTPRRVVARVPAILAKQPDKVEEITGPPVKVAFDAAGKPTRAAESFAEKNQASVTDLVRVTTPKGEYVAVKKRTRGRHALELLSEILPAVITSLSFPKSMYWVAKSGPRFVRPIRWILALLGEGKQARVIRFEIAGVKTGDRTFGHRTLGTEPIRFTGFKDYAKKLRQAGVEFDPQKRRKLVLETVKEALELLDSKLIKDRDLEDWIVNSTEWPQPIIGRFEERFLKLPREILITVMRDHQKYFAVEDRKGNLRPGFVTVLNHKVKRSGLIRAGHERVLTARFRDAEFFWQADQKVPLRDRLPMLERVTYQAKLGSYADKVRRMETIASKLCSTLQASSGQISTAGQAEIALKTVRLSKCDLTTQMVQEFTELEGIVGGLYARAQGEPQEAADAIYDHYLPRSMEDRCPRSMVGATVSLADKIDSVVGGFAVGNAPTGSSDPFGIRRAGNGIIRVLLELGCAVNLTVVVRTALGALNFDWLLPDSGRWNETSAAVLEFLGERLRFYLETVRGFRYDTVRAVMAAGSDVALDALRRAEALEAIRGSEDFIGLSVSAKRIKNILAKSASANDWKPGEPQEALLKEEPERELYHAYAVILSEAKKCHPERSEGTETLRSTQHDRIAKQLERIATLRPAVDRFFDKVLVMAEDRAVRQNRLRLLGKLDELFSSIAHLSEIAPDTSNVDASTLKAGARD